jgi:hypothetical protein
MSNQIELTSTEVELIKLKREQDELKAKEAELMAKADLQQKIINAEKIIEKYEATDQKQIEAAKDFHKGFTSGEWRLEIKSRIAQEIVKKSWDSDSEVLWSKEYTRDEAIITDGTYTIRINKHMTYSSKWSRRGDDKGYKMYLNGPSINWAYEQKPLSKATTIEKKIADIKQTIINKKLQEEKKASALETIATKMKEQFPDAIITTGVDYENSYGRKSEYTPYNKAIINFRNGVSITYKVYEDGSLGRKEILFNRVASQWDLMDALSKMDYPKVQQA